MKKVNVLAIGFLTLILSSCERVAPNYYGVLMTNFGKNGKSDFVIQKGRVNVMAPGTELFQVPAYEQRGQFETDDGKERTLNLKAADNTQFHVKPLYSYKVIETDVIDVVFQNARLGSGDNFMDALEDNVLEPHMYDLIKELSRGYTTDELMASGGSLKFERTVEDAVRKAFKEKGLELLTLSVNLDFSDKVKNKIDSRNEVNTNLSVLDQQIAEQKKKNELARLQAEELRIRSNGLTKEILTEQFIQKWDGKTPLYGDTPINILLSK